VPRLDEHVVSDPRLPSLDDVRIETFCPWCGKRNDMHHNVEAPGVPKPGDVSLCWGCHRASVYGHLGAVRRPTDEEQRAIDADPGVQRALRVMADALSPSDAVDRTRREPGPP
jgi:hypothetical protein